MRKVDFAEVWIKMGDELVAEFLKECGPDAIPEMLLYWWVKRLALQSMENK